jgi:hypothetical protein
MQKADPFVVGAGSGFGVEQGKTFGGQTLHFGMDIGYFEGDMVYAFPLFLYIAGNDAVGGQTLEQFDLGLPLLEKSGGDLLAYYRFRLIAGTSEQPFIQGDGRSEVFNGNANMFHFLHGRFLAKDRRKGQCDANKK